MKTKLHKIIGLPMSIIIFLTFNMCNAEQPPTTAEPATSLQKPVLPQTDPQLMLPSETLPPLDARAAKIAFAAVASLRKGDKAEKASNDFGRLLLRWKPEGRTIKETKIILGQPDWENKGVFGYRFDTGWGGWEWSFANDGKLITHIKRIGLD